MQKLRALREHLEAVIAETDNWRTETERTRRMFMAIRDRVNTALNVVNHEIEIQEINAELEPKGALA